MELILLLRNDLVHHGLLLLLEPSLLIHWQVGRWFPPALLLSQVESYAMVVLLGPYLDWLVPISVSILVHVVCQL